MTERQTVKHVIIAPHPDDEIIGLYQIMDLYKTVVVYIGTYDNNRRERSIKLKEHFKIIGQFWVPDIPPSLIDTETTIYAPDPAYENHPEHRKWGMYCENMLRRGNCKVVFYTTNMNAPYIFDVKEPNKKREILETVYPDQKSLWEYDHKYFLFEGYTKWMIGNNL